MINLLTPNCTHFLHIQDSRTSLAISDKKSLKSMMNWNEKKLLNLNLSGLIFNMQEMRYSANKTHTMIHRQFFCIITWQPYQGALFICHLVTCWFSLVGALWTVTITQNCNLVEPYGCNIQIKLCTRMCMLYLYKCT